MGQGSAQKALGSKDRFSNEVVDCEKGENGPTPTMNLGVGLDWRELICGRPFVSSLISICSVRLPKTRFPCTRRCSLSLSFSSASLIEQKPCTLLGVKFNKYIKID